MAVESRCGLEISGCNYKYVQVSHYCERIRWMLRILDLCVIEGGHNKFLLNQTHPAMC